MSDSECTRCIPGYFFSSISDRCLKSMNCRDGQKPDYISETCINCPLLCTTCDEDRCLTCESGYVIQSDGHCVSECPLQQFALSGVCTACHSDCLKCSGGTNMDCTACYSGVLSQGRCMTECLPNYYHEDKICYPCTSNCTDCPGNV